MKAIILVQILILFIKTDAVCQFSTVSFSQKPSAKITSVKNADLNTSKPVSISLPLSGNETAHTDAVFINNDYPAVVCPPIDGKIEITSGYGDRFHPVLGKELNHKGVDIRCKYRGVRAIADGIIKVQAYDHRSGKYMIIQHANGVESVYCHLDQFLRKTGDTVLARAVIAISGATGTVTGPHLHFGIKLNGTYINPLPFLRAVEAYNN